MKKGCTITVISFILIVVLSVGLFLHPKSYTMPNGESVRVYGLINKNQAKIPGVEYQIRGWAIFMSIVGIETVFVPIIYIGYRLYKPVRLEPIKY